MLTLQVIAAGLLLLGSGFVIRTVIVLDAPSFRPAQPCHASTLVRTAPRPPRHAVPDRRVA